MQVRKVELQTAYHAKVATVKCFFTILNKRIVLVDQYAELRTCLYGKVFHRFDVQKDRETQVFQVYLPYFVELVHRTELAGGIHVHLVEQDLRLDG